MRHRSVSLTQTQAAQWPARTDLVAVDIAQEVADGLVGVAVLLLGLRDPESERSVMVQAILGCSSQGWQCSRGGLDAKRVSIIGTTSRSIKQYAPALPLVASLEPFEWPLEPLEWPLVAGTSGVGHILYDHAPAVEICGGSIEFGERQNFQTLDDGGIYTTKSGKLVESQEKDCG